MKLETLKDKKILILGYGKEGKDTLSFLKSKFPGKKIKVTDRKKNKNYLKGLDKYDVLVKSPGIPFKSIPKSVRKKIITQTDIFFSNCPGKILGVTGTKGKSTTSFLIYKILKYAGKKVHLVGNIGNPALSFLKRANEKDIFVYELSSHQLYNLRQSPDIAVFLNIYPEHLDYYKNFREYARAKANITLWQRNKDFVVFNKKDKLVSYFSQKSKAKKIPVIGEYYELDENAARAVAKLFRIPSVKTERIIKGYKRLEHRMEPIGIYKGITFYNDSLATIPQATILAIKALGNKVQTIFLGGFDRGLNYKDLAREIVKSRIKNIILFPTTGKRIWKEISSLGKKGNIKHFPVKSMKEAVKIAFDKTDKGKVCLLSTASPSFGMFKDYQERGNTFKKYVKELAR